MVTEKPNVSPLGRYSIVQSAALLGVCQSTIRNWLRLGVFKHTEYNKRTVGRQATFIKGAALLRIWNSQLL